MSYKLRPMSFSAPQRDFTIDWLRVFAMLMVFLFHFYIFHQTIIVTIGFYLIDWDIAVLLKYAVLSTTSFCVIMVLYEIFVRRINILRYLFGLKIDRKVADKRQI